MRFMSSNPNEFCDTLKLILQEKRARIDSKIIIEKSFAKVDELK